MYTILAVIFTIICWVVGILFTINFGITQPQYGTKKENIKFSIFFYSGMVVLFIFLPSLGFYFAR